MRPWTREVSRKPDPRPRVNPFFFVFPTPHFSPSFLPKSYRSRGGVTSLPKKPNNPNLFYHEAGSQKIYPGGSRRRGIPCRLVGQPPSYSGGWGINLLPLMTRLQRDRLLLQRQQTTPTQTWLRDTRPHHRLRLRHTRGGASKGKASPCLRRTRF